MDNKRKRDYLSLRKSKEQPLTKRKMLYNEKNTMLCEKVKKMRKQQKWQHKGQPRLRRKLPTSSITWVSPPLLPLPTAWMLVVPGELIVLLFLMVNWK